jgi:hypothetical protein
MMGILVPETCWCNETAYFVGSGWFFTFHHFTDIYELGYEPIVIGGCSVWSISNFLHFTVTAWRSLEGHEVKITLTDLHARSWNGWCVVLSSSVGRTAGLSASRSSLPLWKRDVNCHIYIPASSRHYPDTYESSQQIPSHFLKPHWNFIFRWPCITVYHYSTTKIHSMPSFGGEVKPSVPCRSFAAC